MAQLLRTKEIIAELHSIVFNSSEEVGLISPYLKLSPPTFQILKDAALKSKRIKVLHGDRKLRYEERNPLKEIKNLDLFFLRKLHAKCFYNERTMIISSMNLYSASANNFELGILILREQEPTLFDNAMQAIQAMWNSAKKIPLFPETLFDAAYGSDGNAGRIIPMFRSIRRTLPAAHCIKCPTRIDYNRKKPYCNVCYRDWVKRGNQRLIENKCHRCGEPYSSSKIFPECTNCYGKGIKTAQLPI